jgi:hypothetical protein
MLLGGGSPPRSAALQLQTHFAWHWMHLSRRPEADADIVFRKEELYEAVSIASWMMPLVFAGHVRQIVWLKPPWFVV